MKRTPIVCAQTPLLGAILAKQLNLIGSQIVVRMDDLRGLPPDRLIYLVKDGPKGFPEWNAIVFYAKSHFWDVREVKLQ